MMCKTLLVAVTVLATSVGTVSAAEEALPGVSGDHSIVKPLPEPVDGTPQQGDSVKVGDWDVKISGSVRVDIGVGNLPPPRR